jgi:hypothetical protein
MDICLLHLMRSIFNHQHSMKNVHRPSRESEREKLELMTFSFDSLTARAQLLFRL